MTARRARLLPFSVVGAVGAVLVPLALTAAPGAVAATSTATGGDAASTATVLSLRAGGLGLDPHTIEAVTAVLSATTFTSPYAASVSAVPITADGVKHGEQTVTQDTRTAGPVTQNYPGVVSLSSPKLVLHATSDATQAVAELSSQGASALSVLGLSLTPFTSSLRFGSSVAGGVADASKNVTIKNFALPTLADLLAKLGVPLTALPQGTLAALVDQLGLVTGAITDATTARTGAQSAVTSATSNLTTALGAAPFDDTVVAALLGTLGISAPANAAAWQNLSSTDQASLVAALDTATAGTGTAIATAATALDTALAALQTALDTLTSLLTSALDVPLLSVQELSIGTVARSGAANAASVVGTISGLKVLGTDILAKVTGNSTVDVAGLAAGVVSTVNATIASLVAVVPDVLSALEVPIAVPTPTITVLEKSTSLDKTQPSTSAAAAVTGLAFAWKGLVNVPQVEVDRAVSPRATTTIDVEAKVATLSDASRYVVAAATPATPTNPRTTSGQPPALAETGAPVAVSVVAAVLLCAAYLTRRVRQNGVARTD